MIFNAKQITVLATIASAGLLAHSAHAAPTGLSNGASSSLVQRGFWDDVGEGWNEFKNGFKDGFNSEQDRDLAPEEAGNKKRANKQDFVEVANALRKMGKNAANKKNKKVQARSEVEPRDFWDDVGEGWNEFKGGFKDGFNAEQARPLAPEEVGHKRANKEDFVAVANALRKMGANAANKKNKKVQARDGALDDIGSGFGKGFGNLKNELFGGFDKLKADADHLVHPVVAPTVDQAVKVKRDSWEDDAGNVVGALAGWGSDHIGRISFKRDDLDARDSWEDDLGNIAGAGAGWVTDHVGRIDPSDLIPSKGLKKAISRRDTDEDLLA